VQAELPLLIVITDWQISAPKLIESLESVLSLGPEVALQHRHPGASDRLFFEEGERLVKLCRRVGNPLFVNGRLDMALLLGAHLHLPARGIQVTDVRPHLPPGTWISAAVHDSHEALEAGGADLALVSPVFAPGSKPTDLRAPLGPAGFARLVKATPCPAFALGGIAPANASQIEGASGFAAISSVLKDSDPILAAKALLSAARSARGLATPSHLEIG
jgi:thiamine-phosphate pyrophosphorylase